MTEKTIEKAKIFKEKTYVAKDGKEFDSKDKCITYESELDLNHLADKYKMKFIEVPTIICDDSFVDGVSFYFPQDGNEDEVLRLLSIFQNYVIDKNGDRWEIDWTRNLSNVRNSDFEIKMPSLTKGEIYIFYFCWQEECDSYDYYCKEIVSKKKAESLLKNEVKRLEEVFETKFEEIDE